MATYTPDPADATQPVDTVIAGTAAAEFRALKGRVNSLASGGFTVNAGTRNLIRNPSFLINQRSVGPQTTDGAYFADGWRIRNFGAGRFSAAQYLTDYPSGAGGAIFLVVATGGPAVNDAHGLIHVIEGFDTRRLRWGTVNASAVTLSFNFFSQVAGNYPIVISNNTNTRSITQLFNYPVAGVVQRITVTLPGDTTGAWDKTTGAGMVLNLILQAGTNAQCPTASLGIWQGAGYLGAVGQVQLAQSPNGTSAAIWDVQLEEGSFATQFVYAPITEQIEREYRYYQTTYPPGNPVGTIGIPQGAASFLGINGNDFIATQSMFPVEMRTTPAITLYNPVTGGASNIRYIAGGANIGMTGGMSANGKGMYAAQAAGAITTGFLYMAHLAINADF